MVQNNCGIPRLKFKPIRINKEGQMVEELTEDVGPMSEVQEKYNGLWLFCGFLICRCIALQYF